MSDTETWENRTVRRPDEDNDETAKVHISFDANNFNLEKSPMRFLLQTRNAGAVIGIRGENVHRLEKECDAQITIPEGKSPERILMINPNTQSLVNCLRKIIEWLKDYKGANSPIEIKPLIHQSHIEFFTPEFVEKITQNSNCEVKLAKVNCPCSNERVISLKGTIDQISLAVPIIQNHLTNNPIRGSEGRYIPQLYSNVAIDDYLGWDHKEGYGQKKLPKNQKTVTAGSMDRERGEPSGKRRRDEEYSYTIMKIAIPFDLSAAAFGSDGKRLARIRKESGADVIVTDSTIRDEVIATMSGSDSEIKQARRMLEDHIWYYSS